LSVGEEDEWPEPDERKVIVMKLKVRCKRNPKASEGATIPTDKYTDAHGICVCGLIVSRRPPLKI